MIGIYIVMLFVCFKLAFNYFYNAVVIYRYNNYDYSVNVSPLLICNWFESYVAHYNNGNIYYKNDRYEDAITEYQKALEGNPPQKKECAIRINLALAMLKTLGEDYNEPEHIEDSILILKEARDVLLEENCATENGDGHSATAEQLKEEIEAMIRELEEKKESEADTEDADDTQEAQEQKEAEDAFEEDVKKALQERQSEANKERKQSMDYYENFDKDYNFDYDGYIW